MPRSSSGFRFIASNDGAACRLAVEEKASEEEDGAEEEEEEAAGEEDLRSLSSSSRSMMSWHRRAEKEQRGRVASYTLAIVMMSPATSSQMSRCVLRQCKLRCCDELVTRQGGPRCRAVVPSR